MSRARWRDYLAAGRVANLPSVVSNVVLGAWAWGLLGSGKLDWSVTAWTVLVGMGLYLGGCFLNDWWDREWDRLNKPTRAVPSGRLPATHLRNLAGTGLALSLLGAFFLGKSVFWVAVGIAGLILIYTVIHKRTPWGVVPMGLCRAGLYGLGFAAAGAGETTVLESREGVLLLLPLGLWAYIMGLSLLARYEAKGNLPIASRNLAQVLLFLPLATHNVWLFEQRSLLWVALAILPFAGMVGWAIRQIRTNLGSGVSSLLAALPLLDFIFVFSTALTLDSRGSLWGLIFLPLLAFLLGLFLQKITPAT